MNNPIPHQLCNPNFKFFLAKKNGKIPIEVRWNSDNNYNFFEPKLLNHLAKGGNMGVVTGIGGLIVIDFDDKAYQDTKDWLLPKTFTVRTAGKGLKHMYYILLDPMIKKVGIGLEPRVCDIQANRSGVVCPPSSINGRFYEVLSDIRIATIDYAILSRIFEIRGFNGVQTKEYAKEKAQPEKVKEAIEYFRKIGIKRAKERHFQCPFHSSTNGSNLYVGDDGFIFCFHCMRHWNDIADFKAKWEEYNGGIVIE